MEEVREGLSEEVTSKLSKTWRMSRNLSGKEWMKEQSSQRPWSKRACHIYLDTEESQGSWDIVNKRKVVENEVENYTEPCQNLIKSKIPIIVFARYKLQRLDLAYLFFTRRVGVGTVFKRMSNPDLLILFVSRVLVLLLK